jgi:hypothetical protein
VSSTDPVNIEKNTAKSTTEDVEYTVRGNGRIKGELAVSFPPGPEGLIQVDLQIVEPGGKGSRPVITSPGNAYVSGDSIRKVWVVDVPVYAFEIIRARVTNADATNAHDWGAEFSVVYP